MLLLQLPQLTDNCARMGLGSWIAAGMVAWLSAQLVRSGLRSRWVEAGIALLISVTAGVGATALDFGGWSELDPRAVLFAFLCASTAIALGRLVRYRPARDA